MYYQNNLEPFCSDGPRRFNVMHAYRLIYNIQHFHDKRHPGFLPSLPFSLCLLSSPHPFHSCNVSTTIQGACQLLSYTCCLLPRPPTAKRIAQTFEIYPVISPLLPVGSVAIANEISISDGDSWPLEWRSRSLTTTISELA